MREFEGLSRELKTLLERNHFIRGIMGMDALLIMGGGLAMIVLPFISLGPLGEALSFINTIFGYIKTGLSFAAYYGLILGVILAFANNNSLFIYGGFGILTAESTISFARIAYYRSFSLYTLLEILLFGYLTYSFYKMDQQSKVA